MERNVQFLQGFLKDSQRKRRGDIRNFFKFFALIYQGYKS